MTIVNDILNQMPGLGQPQRKFLATLFVTILVLVAPQLTVVTSTIVRSGVAVSEKDGHAASVVPSEIAAPETTTVHASSSNGPSSPPPWPVSSAVSGINSHAACKSYQWSAKKLEFGILTYESVR